MIWVEWTDRLDFRSQGFIAGNGVVLSTMVKGSAVPSKKASAVPLPIVSTPKKSAAASKRKAPTLFEATDARITPQQPNASKTMHQSVMKIFRDNLKDSEEWALHHVVHDDKDLYARLTHDKENKTRTGKYYFSELRDLYQPAQANVHEHSTAMND